MDLTRIYLAYYKCVIYLFRNFSKLLTKKCNGCTMLFSSPIYCTYLTFTEYWTLLYIMNRQEDIHRGLEEKGPCYVSVGHHCVWPCIKRYSSSCMWWHIAFFFLSARHRPITLPPSRSCAESCLLAANMWAAVLPGCRAEKNLDEPIILAIGVGPSGQTHADQQVTAEPSNMPSLAKADMPL